MPGWRYQDRGDKVITSSGECVQCTHFEPHVHYPYVGLCATKNEVVESSRRVEACTSFRVRTFDEIRDSMAEKGWAYCVFCRKTLVSLEELEEHVLKGHIVSGDVLVDDVIAEEAPSGD